MMYNCISVNFKARKLAEPLKISHFLAFR